MTEEDLVVRNEELADMLGWSPREFGHGRIDEAFVAAVKQLQLEAMLPVTGVVDLETYKVHLDKERMRNEREREQRYKDEANQAFDPDAIGVPQDAKERGQTFLGTTVILTRRIWKYSDYEINNLVDRVREGYVDNVAVPSGETVFDATQVHKQSGCNLFVHFPAEAPIIADFEPWTYSKGVEGFIALATNPDHPERYFYQGHGVRKLFEGVQVSSKPVALAVDFPHHPWYSKMQAQQARSGVVHFDALMPLVPPDFEAVSQTPARGNVDGWISLMVNGWNKMVGHRLGGDAQLKWKTLPLMHPRDHDHNRIWRLRSAVDNGAANGKVFVVQPGDMANLAAFGDLPESVRKVDYA